MSANRLWVQPSVEVHSRERGRSNRHRPFWKNVENTWERGRSHSFLKIYRLYCSNPGLQLAAASVPTPLICIKFSQLSSSLWTLALRHSLLPQRRTLLVVSSHWKWMTFGYFCCSGRRQCDPTAMLGQTHLMHHTHSHLAQLSHSVPKHECPPRWPSLTSLQSNRTWAHLSYLIYGERPVILPSFFSSFTNFLNCCLVSVIYKKVLDFSSALYQDMFAVVCLNLRWILHKQ